MIGVSVLGATGSIGKSTLDVLSRHSDRFQVVAVTANSRVDEMVALCRRHRPRYAVMSDCGAAQRLEQTLRRDGLETVVLAGMEGLERVASLPEVDHVMAAIVGAAGVRPTLAAARAGKRILLANKESLVMSGRLFMEEVRRHNAELLPIDSEHNAIFQCLPAEFATARGMAGAPPVGVRRILLTASGGPFRTWSRDAMQGVTPAQACAHPKWVMGRKISVDSATLMNKGLEVIEACWLFGVPPEQVQVVLHPQSVIHSMVEYVDGSILAQLGNPDMRIPISYALAWPQRVDSGAQSLDMFTVGALEFDPPDTDRFPCLRLAYEAMRAGGTAPTVLNAANEVAVQAFLEERLPFSGIPRLIEATLAERTVRDMDSLETVFEEDAAARAIAAAAVQKISQRSSA